MEISKELKERKRDIISLDIIVYSILNFEVVDLPRIIDYLDILFFS